MFTIEYKRINGRFDNDWTNYDYHCWTTFAEVIAYIQTSWVDNWTGPSKSSSFYQIAADEWYLEQKDGVYDRFYLFRILKNGFPYIHNSPWKIGLCSQ